MNRRPWLVALLSAAVFIGLIPAATLAAVPPLPSSIVATGDSISQATSSGGSLGAVYPQNSWSTGTSTSVNSHYLRLLALNGAISGQRTNLSFNGARVSDLNGQMQQAVGLQPDYLTVLIGGNDLCTDTVAQMTPTSTFAAQFDTALTTLESGSPSTNVFVGSIPNVYHLWELFHSNFWARIVWGFGDICQSLLANPTSTNQADVARRAAVAQRNIEYNAALADVCAAHARCRWDGYAVYNTVFTSSDAAGDYFHPSISGQAKLAAVTWAAGYWADGAPPANQPPTAAFGYSCIDLSCTFDAGASTDADGSLVSYAWTFGAEGTGSGVTATHAFATAGTYDVTLQVTDDDEATSSTTQAVTVSAPPPPPDGTVTVSALSGQGAPRKGGWTASVTISLVDGDGAPVAGGTVSGSWSSGGSDSCTTAASGSCSVSVNVNKKTASVTWTVLDVAHSTLAYEPGLTQVAIFRP
jgi:lysophospholipase L1-like esterase